MYHYRITIKHIWISGNPDSVSYYKSYPTPFHNNLESQIINESYSELLPELLENLGYIELFSVEFLGQS